MTDWEEITKHVAENLDISSDTKNFKVLGGYRPDDRTKVGKKPHSFQYPDVYYSRYLEIKNRGWLVIQHLETREDAKFIYLPFKSGRKYPYQGNVNFGPTDLYFDEKMSKKELGFDGRFKGSEEFKVKKSEIELDLLITHYWDDGSCYITTTCVEHKGLPDNCLELETLRGLRDNYFKNIAGGKEMIKEYYQKAPGLVRTIKAHPDKDQLLNWGFNEIKKAVNLTIKGKHAEAVDHYQKTVIKLEQKVNS